MFKSYEEAAKRYGAIVNNKWADEAKWMTTYRVPEFVTAWINTITKRPVQRIYCNRDMAPMLDKALANLRDRGLLGELKTFDGCFNIRPVRGYTDKYSSHSYGLSLDLNAAENPLGKKGKLSPEFVKAWTDAGWTWGGSWKRRDDMHFGVVAF